MTLKEMFKKVETYNEMADLMRTEKARIYFADVTHICSFGDHFTGYAEIRKYIRHEYVSEVADKLLKEDGFEFDEYVTIECEDGHRIVFTAELVAA